MNGLLDDRTGLDGITAAFIPCLLFTRLTVSVTLRGTDVRVGVGAVVFIALSDALALGLILLLLLLLILDLRGLTVVAGTGREVVREAGREIGPRRGRG